MRHRWFFVGAAVRDRRSLLRGSSGLSGLVTYRPSRCNFCEECVVDQAMARFFGHRGEVEVGWISEAHPPEHSGTPFGGNAAIAYPPYLPLGSGLSGLGLRHLREEFFTRSREDAKKNQTGLGFSSRSSRLKRE